MSKNYYKYWIITDTHFGHDKMIKYCDRPEDFEYLILSNLSMICPGSVLIHLGDICIRRDAYWHKVFMDAIPPGVKKWLVRGNHDKKTIPWYIDHGWDCIADRLDIRMYSKDIALSHIPLPDDSTYDFNIHGHQHITGHHPECEVHGKHRLALCEHDYEPKLMRHFVGV